MNDSSYYSVSTSERRKLVFRVPTKEQEWQSFLDNRCSFEPGKRHYTRPRATRKAFELGIPKEQVIKELLNRCGYHAGGEDERKVREDVEKFYCSGTSEGGSRRRGGDSTHQSDKTRDVPMDSGLVCQVIASSSFGLTDLQRLSPEKLQSLCTEEIIDVLFPAGALLCVGYSKYDFVTLAREELRGTLSQRQFIVPHEMRERKGRRRKDGNLSDHTLDNTGPWRFLVLEWDQARTIDEQARLILHLHNHCSTRLALVVYSGQKSLHAWFLVRDWTDDQREALAASALKLGACRGTIANRSQFVRMPGGLRRFSDGRIARQAVHYLNAGDLP